MADAKKLYLDLMKRSLTNWIYGEYETAILEPKKNPIKRAFYNILGGKGLKIAKPVPMNAERRTNGFDRSPIAHTMIGLRRLDNIESCAKRIIEEKIPGDFIETGVWRGGATIFMKAMLKAYGISDRLVWVADSFEGCPRPSKDNYPEDKDDILYTSRELAISMEEVKSNFARYELLDDQVRFLKGWFKDTLPNIQTKTIALMRLDGDMYESTMDALNNLYPKLSIGGFVIIDDYGAMSSCKKAVEDFRRLHKIDDEIKEIDWTGVWWRRTK